MSKNDGIIMEEAVSGLPNDLCSFIEEMQQQGKDGPVETCTICGQLERDENGKAIICLCKKMRAWSERFEQAGVPPKYHHRTLEDWNLRQDPYGYDLGPDDLRRKLSVSHLMSKYIKALPAICGGLSLIIPRQRTADIRVSNLVLVGGGMSGKTLLATIAAMAAVRKNLRVQYYDWSDFSHYMNSYEYKEKQDEIVEAWATKDFIVLDGVEEMAIKGTVMSQQLNRAARARIGSNKPILITCYEGYEKVDGGHGWRNLIDTAFTYNLPTPKPPKPRAF